MAHSIGKWPIGGDSVVCVWPFWGWKCILWIVTATLITTEMDPRKFRWENERETEITKYRGVSCRSADDIKKNVYPPKSTREKQKNRNDNNSIISAPVFIFFGRTLFYTRFISHDGLQVIAARVAAGQLMQHFILVFFIFRHSCGARIIIIAIRCRRMPFSLIYIRIFTFLYSEYLPENQKQKLFVYLVCIYKLCARTVLHQLSSFSFFGVRADAMAWANWNVTIEVYRSNQQTIGQKNRLKYLSIHQVGMRRAIGLAAGVLWVVAEFESGP